MKIEYAIESRDILGNNRAWFDAYPSAPLACKDAKEYVKEHPHLLVKVLKREKNATNDIGAKWSTFRTIRP